MNLDLPNFNIDQKALHEAIMSHVPSGIVLYEIDNDTIRIIEASNYYYEILGYTDKSDHPGTVGHLIKSNDDILGLARTIKKCVKTQKMTSYEGRITRFDNAMCWMSIKCNYLDKSENGNPLVFATLTDITEAKKSQLEVTNQSERFKIIAESTEEIYLEYVVANDTFILTNCFNRYNEEDNIIREYWTKEKCKKFIHPNDFEGFKNAWFSSILVSPHKGNIEFRTKAYDDDYTWYKMLYVSVADDDGEVTNIYARLYNNEQIKSMKNTIASDKEVIERLSTTDEITGLLNRKTFKRRVADFLLSDFDPNYCYCIAYSDINDFSYVNDNFGYDAGNETLIDFAKAISKVDCNVYACRIFSDFYVGFYKAESREALIEKIKVRNDYFTKLQKQKYPASDIHISCGLYVVTDRNVDVTIAMDNANLARRSVKGSKDIPCGIYTERMRRKRSHDQAIASELQSALDNGQVELFLQPKFSLDTREIIGAEALSRWRNADGSYKMPYEFISILENVGYIVDLDYYIYEQVLKTLARWKVVEDKLLPISINFSRHHNSYTNFVDKIITLANEYDIDRNLLEIEITESCFTHDVNVLFANMRKLRESGFKINIDDFGMGYSSLSVLLNAPIDTVKVDKVFIDNITNSPRARDYINQICNLITSTDKDIIFEGVETENQATILCNSGHKKAQGWLFDKALSVSDFEKKYVLKM